MSENRAATKIVLSEIWPKYAYPMCSLLLFFKDGGSMEIFV
jgi:hypothetical protein